eukprot:1242118-Amorphochlora_amoeboformis.AAC.2
MNADVASRPNGGRTLIIKSDLTSLDFETKKKTGGNNRHLNISPSGKLLHTRIFNLGRVSDFAD